MTGKISLTASMRSNLLSLQNISRQVSSTQNKLATGNKVNSAIDNPSSYYTARSLTNRANDLDALLNSMGQAVSTIKTATTALETGSTFLEQAAAVATSALETNTIPSKEWFEEKVGENGAVVTTAQELKDAINSDKETIVIYGKIDYFEGGYLQLKEGQKLVGTEYFTGYTGKERFSRLNLKNTSIYTAQHSLLSDFDINILAVKNVQNVVQFSKADGTIVNNISVNIDQQSTIVEFVFQVTASDVKFSGHIKISGNAVHNLWFYNVTNSPMNVEISGVFEADNNRSPDLFTIRCAGDGHTSNMHLVIKSNSILRNNTDYIFSIQYDDGSLPNTVTLEEGVTLVGKNLQLMSREQVKYTSTSKDIYVFSISEHQQDKSFAVSERKSEVPQTEDDKSYLQYKTILTQYDSIIKDSSYKGVNLLKNEKLNVRFNENGSANLNVNGKDMTSNSLGLSTVEWSNQGDIAQSLQEIASALKSIRAFSAELGNNYSIITNRQEFTENLINILTEGADKLTLADMNEESANMLSLQTRQQLAINSLSLASQASQSILKLF